MTWADTTLTDFEAAVKSSDPTPGGGTVAAVALGQAAALLSMVADLTLSSDRWSDAHQAAHDAKAAAAAVMPRASHLADADAHANRRKSSKTIAINESRPSHLSSLHSL